MKSNIKATRSGRGIASIETNSQPMTSASGINSHCAADCDAANSAMSGMNNAAPRIRRRVPDGEAATMPESNGTPSVSQRRYCLCSVDISGILAITAKPPLTSGKILDRHVKVVG